MYCIVKWVKMELRWAAHSKCNLNGLYWLNGQCNRTQKRYWYIMICSHTTCFHIKKKKAHNCWYWCGKKGWLDLSNSATGGEGRYMLIKIKEGGYSLSNYFSCCYNQCFIEIYCSASGKAIWKYVTNWQSTYSLRLGVNKMKQKIKIS